MRNVAYSGQQSRHALPMSHKPLGLSVTALSPAKARELDLMRIPGIRPLRHVRVTRRTPALFDFWV